MAVLKVARLGHPVIRQKAQIVPPDRIGSPEMQRLIDDMIETMHDYDGVGLAAPQVAVSLQIAVIECQGNPRYPDAPAIPLTVLINPRILSTGGGQEEDWEGCLSVDALRGKVPRWRTLEVEALDRQGRPLKFTPTEFFARVVQHECDHLNGRVFLDRMPNMLSLTHLPEFLRYGSKNSV